MSDKEKNRSHNLTDIIEKYNLTDRQIEIIRLRSLGYTKRTELASKVGISERTLFREMENKNVQMAIGALSLILLEENQTDARTLANKAMDYLGQVIDSPDFPADLKIKASKYAIESTSTMDRLVLENKISEIFLGKQQALTMDQRESIQLSGQ